ncbi:helix-turn-helix transcriptional regulator [uncultured Cohaesibacter sp.]|uniref:helix-turn-helix domain-containing protein n=1 Tax=uncultured Cohaesibacter sp. TaxID=1002546 RepID=UPI0029C70637|nr:helix-turn-helix transcriptional regulator [uncultured Cohaesibacter sp.]
MTTFKSALGVCGLSQQEAAEFLSVSLGSVKDWCRGKSAPPLGVWAQLANLYSQIEDAADYASARLDADLMDRRVLNNIEADNGADPLPGGASSAAGAMALLLAIKDIEEM